MTRAQVNVEATFITLAEEPPYTLEELLAVLLSLIHVLLVNLLNSGPSTG